ncbi:hypothetical protein RI578_29105 [Streptomyces sp. BB1-1-1]|uniref:hypothetical protein n=1 Tax=Streptomyces sp. BB1-1-1 TaxID=3074430 RepID=UPI002877CC9B|nr:hypothetical protein [Streptomyces sp. BB1-1-1]WND38092.1 hypothetical protein RI578_29105 [Streptomyces sp. BB1-1-1]
MTAITIEFTEEELAELRAEAQERGVAVERLAHDALIEGVQVRLRTEARLFRKGKLRKINCATFLSWLR